MFRSTDGTWIWTVTHVAGIGLGNAVGSTLVPGVASPLGLADATAA